MHSTNNVYELVIKISKDLEILLEDEFGASGRGLHEKISSVQTELPAPLVKRMRYLATIRNRLVHGDIASVPDRPAFVQAYEQSKRELQSICQYKKAAQEQALQEARAQTLAQKQLKEARARAQALLQQQLQADRAQALTEQRTQTRVHSLAHQQIQAPRAQIQAEERIQADERRMRRQSNLCCTIL